MSNFRLLSSGILILLANGAFSQKKTPVVYKDSVITAFFQRESGVTAADGGFSIPLSDGRVLWTFGDSFIDNYDPKTKTVPCLFQVNNAAVIQPKNDWDWKNAQTLIGDIKGQNEGFGRSLWKSTTKGEFYWPVAGIQLSDTVYIFCSGVKLTGTGTLGFDYSGQNVLAKMKFPEMKVVGYKTLQDFYSIHYGIGFINDKKTGYTYVYGIKTVPKNNDLYVARFPTKNPNTLWEAWDGKNWNSNMAKAACIKSNVGATPYISKVKNKILMVSSAYSVGCDMGKDISSATSSRFMGPFSDLKTIYTIPDRLNGHSPFFYVPASHPEYINSKNELLVTYCINGYGTCVTGCNDGRMEADRYRVRGICVPLSLIDPALK